MTTLTEQLRDHQFNLGMGVWGVLQEMPGIRKISRIHPLGTMNVSILVGIFQPGPKTHFCVQCTSSFQSTYTIASSHNSHVKKFGFQLTLAGTSEIAKMVINLLPEVKDVGRIITLA